MKIDNQDKIDDYLLNRMSNEERLAFEKVIECDEELQKQLTFTEDVRRVMKERNERLSKMEKWKDDYVWEDEEVAAASAAKYRPTGSGYDYCPAPAMKSRRSMKSSPFKKKLYWGAGIAALFIVGVLFLNQYRLLYNHSSTEIAKESSPHPNYSLPDANDNVSFRGRSQDVDIESQLAMGDYSKALARIEMDEAGVRADLMLLERESYSRGEFGEDAMAEKDSLEMKLGRLHFFKAQALIGLERLEEALELLDEIRHSSSLYSGQADSLYQMIQP